MTLEERFEGILDKPEKKRPVKRKLVTQPKVFVTNLSFDTDKKSHRLKSHLRRITISNHGPYAVEVTLGDEGITLQVEEQLNISIESLSSRSIKFRRATGSRGTQTVTIIEEADVPVVKPKDAIPPNQLTRMDPPAFVEYPITSEQEEQEEEPRWRRIAGRE